MYIGVINWYTEAHVNLCSALWPFDFHFLFLSDCLNWGMAQKTSWSEEMTDSESGRETNYFSLCWDPAKKRAGRQIKLGRTRILLDMVHFVKREPDIHEIKWWTMLYLFSAVIKVRRLARVIYWYPFKWLFKWEINLLSWFNCFG